MRCPFCGKHSHSDICPFCGLDKRLEVRIRHTADGFYRRGYEAASGGDYYGATRCLQKALRYDGRNTQTLNLLGLVYYQTGNIGEAVQLWQRSLRLEDREENRAHQYMKELHQHESHYRAMRDAVKLYNDALEQCKNGSLDYAVARLKKAVSVSKGFVKAELLLTLCYIEQHQFKKALAILEKVQRQDPLHPQIARYRRLIALMAQEGQEDAQELDVQDVSDSISVRSSLTEPDLLEIFGTGKNKHITLRNWHNTLSQIGMFAAGAVCCLAFVYTLLFPARVDTLQGRVVSLEADNAALSADKEQLQQELLGAQQESYQIEQSRTELENQLKLLQNSTDGSMDGGLAAAVTLYLNNQYEECAKELLAIQADELEDADAALYARLREGLADRSESLYQEGYQAYVDAQETEGEARKELFNTAVEKLLVAQEFLENGTSQQYYAMYYLGRAYYFQEEYAKARDQMERFLTVYLEEDELRDAAQQLYYDAESLAG